MRLEQEPAITRRKGLVIRRPLRAQTAEDEFFNSLVAQMEVGAQAYRVATAQGLRGKARREHMARLVADTGSEAWQRAMNVAVKLAFSSEPGALGQALMVMRRNVPGTCYIQPFLQTPGSIVKMGLRKTPLGTPNLLVKLFNDGSMDSEKVKLTAEQLSAWSLAFGLAQLFGLLGEEDDEPRITGSLPWKGTKRGERERALAIMKLEECVMRANVAIARNE